MLSLALREAEITEECITNQGIRLNVRAVAAFKVGEAKAELEATERELDAAAMKAQYQRDMAIKQAGYQAETEQAKARAAQAGPLTEAQASQEVSAQQTALAQRQAELAAQRLEAEVRRPADAEAYRKRTIAEADRDQSRFATEAEAFRKRAMAEADRDQARLAAEAEAYRQKTLADAQAQSVQVKADAEAHAERSLAEGQSDANRARADSLRQGNQELIAADRLMENLPAIVESAARGLAGANLTVLNGTQGLNEVVAGLIGQGMSILDLVKKAAANGNGSIPAQVTDGQGTAELN
jgi:flotillin